MTLESVILAGDLSDGSESPVSGTLTFWPSGWLTDTTATIIAPSPVRVPLGEGGTFSVSLLATDNTEPPPGTWLWNVRICVTGTAPRAFSFSLLRAAGAEQNLAAIIPVAPADVVSAYDAGGDLDGTYPDPQVVSTHLGSPLPQAQGGTGNDAGVAANVSGVVAIANGGSGQSGRQSALNALAGTQAAGEYLRSDGTNTGLAAIPGTDLPAATGSAPGALVLAGDLGGTAVSPQVTGTHLAAPMPLAQGGTGSSSQNFAGLLTMTAAVKTAGYSAAPGDYVRADATAGSFVVTLPSAPANLTTIAAKLTGTTGTNTVTVTCQGSDVMNKTAGPITYVLQLVNQGAVFQYSAGIWLVTADNLPLGQLDTRYALAGTAALLSGAQFTGALAEAAVNLADAATIAVNAALGNTFRVPIAGNRTLANPTGLTDNQKIIFEVTQDATGSRTLSYGSAYEFSASLPAPVLSTAPGKTDLLGFIWHAATSQLRFVAFLPGF